MISVDMRFHPQNSSVIRSTSLDDAGSLSVWLRCKTLSATALFFCSSTQCLRRSLQSGPSPTIDNSRQRQMALSKWDNESGARPQGPQEGSFSSEVQLDLAREMATYISPRPGFTQPPSTIHAAAQMIDLVERAGHFRLVRPS